MSMSMARLWGAGLLLLCATAACDAEVTGFDEESSGCVMHCEPCQGLFQQGDAVNQHNFGTVDGRAFMFMQLTYDRSCHGMADVVYTMHWDGSTLTHDDSVSVIDDIELAVWSAGGWYEWQDRDLRAHFDSIGPLHVRMTIVDEGTEHTQDCQVQDDDSLLCESVSPEGAPTP